MPAVSGALRQRPIQEVAGGGSPVSSCQRKARSCWGDSARNLAHEGPGPTLTVRKSGGAASNIDSSDSPSPASSTERKGWPKSALSSQRRRMTGPFRALRQDTSTLLWPREILLCPRSSGARHRLSRRCAAASAASSASSWSATSRKCQTNDEAFSSMWLWGIACTRASSSSRTAMPQALRSSAASAGACSPDSHSSAPGRRIWKPCSAMSVKRLRWPKWASRKRASLPLIRCGASSSRRSMASSSRMTSSVGAARSGRCSSSRRVPS
mmetsp:Transcript_52286/g.151943  ORF Transcript_52286/g.151943 Transcript_52286/m.151943 type:complete len:268 (+) Transcript_52286:65-868(+)